MPKKSVQVRIPVDLSEDLALVAPASGKSIPEYVEAVLRAAVARDMPRAARLAAKRAEALKKDAPKPAEGGDDA